MGKYLIIKGSDFESKQIEKVNISKIPTQEGWVDVDLSIYENQHFIVYNSLSTENNATDGKCFGLLPNNDAYIIPVRPGDKFIIRCCNSHDVYSVAAVSSREVPSFKGDIMPYPSFINGILSVSENEVVTGIEKEFTIPSGCYFIYICGRNSGNINFVEGYSLSLKKMVLRSQELL